MQLAKTFSKSSFISVAGLPIHQFRKYQLSVWELLFSQETDSNETALFSSLLNYTWLFYLPEKLSFASMLNLSPLRLGSKPLKLNFTLFGCYYSLKIRLNLSKPLLHQLDIVKFATARTIQLI
ncbi:MAG TPA: hypothetical protein DDW76_26370 [Cyanobacteria bacterium UBA11369]|nr:hypothetical protein [Cyanobacteria bacterium UBA11371]HBE36741.1 hypothetical protein [Cyanobacteria bacterium UBA11368]HBE52199.1 hypothetical protein [Cyanobacteria bacterium UBA11369]